MADAIDPFAGMGFVPQGSAKRTAPAAQIDPFAGYEPQKVAPEPVQPKILAVDDFGRPIYDESTPEGAAAGHDMRNTETRMMEKVGEGATFGLLPYGVAAAKRVAGTPWDQGLKEARDYTEQTSADYPVASAVGEGIGSMLPLGRIYSLAKPAVEAATRVAPRVGKYLANTILGAGVGGVSSAGHDIGMGQTDNLGHDTAVGSEVGAGLSAITPVIGRGLQAIPNMARGLYTGLKNIYGTSGQEGIAGNVLREASGDFANGNAVSPIRGLTLRTPQSTNNPGLMKLEDALGADQAGTIVDTSQHVVKGTTPGQLKTLAEALLPGYAGEEPVILANEASRKGVNAVRGVNSALIDIGRQKWSDPALSGVTFDGDALAKGVASDVARLPASFRNEVTGPQGMLGPFLTEIQELGPNPSLQDLNSIRSRLLGVARDASSGPQPNSVKATAANSMAGSILDRMGADASIAGRESSVIPGGITEKIMPNGTVQSVHVPAQITPGVDANPEAWAAYQAARDFTRGHHTATGYSEFDRILHPNNSGNFQGNAERQFGQFFDVGSGTDAGLQRLSGLANFARTHGANDVADNLEQAMQNYHRTAILKAARTGGQVDAAGNPIINPAAMFKAVNVNMPAVVNSPVQLSPGVAPIAHELSNVGTAASYLNRPNAVTGARGSATFDRLKSNDLVSAILGQSGSSALGAGLGGYEAYQNGPEGISPFVRIPLGMVAGAAAAHLVGPLAGKAINAIPMTGALTSGPAKAIEKKLAGALADPKEYNRLMQALMPEGPDMLAPGAISRSVPWAAWAATPSITAGGKQ